MVRGHQNRHRLDRTLFQEPLFCAPSGIPGNQKTVLGKENFDNQRAVVGASSCTLQQRRKNRHEGLTTPLLRPFMEPANRYAAALCPSQKGTIDAVFGLFPGKLAQPQGAYRKIAQQPLGTRHMILLWMADDDTA